MRKTETLIFTINEERAISWSLAPSHSSPCDVRSCLAKDQAGRGERREQQEEEEKGMKRIGETISS